MAPLGEENVEAAPQEQRRRDYEVHKQRVDLDVDFAGRALKGSTEIIFHPATKDLRQVRLHCRQCRPTQVQAGGITAKWEYEDPYKRCVMGERTTVHQHDMLKKRIAKSLRPTPEPQLVITLPPKLKIQELQIDPATSLPQYNETPSLQKQEADAMAVAETPILPNLQVQFPQFAPIKLTIEFEVQDCRDGVHWVGCGDDDKRYPHMYTKLEAWPGNTSSLFPCLDDENSKCRWDIAIRCPRTLGDAFRKPKPVDTTGQTESIAKSADGDVEMTNGIDAPSKPKGANSAPVDEYLIDLGPEDAALELSVVCVGEQTDDVADSEDDTKHTVTFSLGDSVVAARHIAFAIGPFEYSDLASFRAPDEENKLASISVKVGGWCLPGRSAELENTCYPTCQAVDHLSVNCGRFPFPTYQLLFVDDMIHDTAGAAGLSICSNRLLFSQDIIEPLDRNTKILIRAVAEQWSGVFITPKAPEDTWVVAGIAGYLTDMYLRKLCGNNHYRWEQKLASEKVYDLDVDRPSLHQQGRLLHLDASVRDFLNLKSAAVLGILDRRLLKSSGSTGVMRIVGKIFLNARTSESTTGELSTQDFQKTCEKLGHNKLESFFRQWVWGAGCPIFHVSQRFNKKKLVVEMTIHQRQLERQTKPEFAPNNFMREVKEHVQEVWAPETQSVFTGPMTIRIHEADGTPYEHIVEIKEPLTKLEIPYNTKYKRLKRSRRAKERAVAAGTENEDGSDALLYCLGDILDTAEDVKDWNLAEWGAEEEEKMSTESYEWIRIDADFEWIGKIHLVMPLYMYISQLQQDRDLVAQYESMRFLLGSNPHHVSLTILVRTLMDVRYFYGIRVMATEGLAMLAKNKLVGIGQHHLMKAFATFFCANENDVMPRPNDFNNRINFIMQCAIPKAMARLRDEEGRVPQAVQQFFVDKLVYNDNSDNPFSDCHYLATLMTCLADSLVASHREVAPENPFHFDFEEEAEEPPEPENPDAPFENEVVNLIERHRRLDEWAVTYQNVYTTTAIQCLQKLSNAGIVKDKTRELLQYTQPSTADNVRLEAYRCLTEMGVTKKMSMMKHLLHSLVNDRSPYFRDQLMRVFGEALGHIALGDKEVVAPAQAPVNDGGLVLDDAGSSEMRRIEATRKTTPEGAIAALKIALGSNESLKQAVWYATTAPTITVDEIGVFCDAAALMFDAITSYVVTIKLPRPYSCRHEGKGKMRFVPHGSYRTKPSKGLAWDDYELVEEHGLKYTGPLDDTTNQNLRARQQQTALKLSIAKAQQDLARKQSEEATMAMWQAQQQQQQAAQQQASMPPPSSIPATPVEQKSGFKLNLGNTMKRKPSVDLGTQREPASKVLKINKASTPGSASSKAPGGRRDSTTPSSKIGRSKVVALDLGIAGSRRASEILVSPSVPGRASASQPSGKKIIPAKAQRQNSQAPLSATFPAPPPMPSTNSPAGATPAYSPPPPSLTSTIRPLGNLGGFRSFGDGSDANAPPAALTGFTASPDTASPVGFRSASVSRDGHANALSLSPPPLSASPPSLTTKVPGSTHAHPSPGPPLRSLSAGVTSLSAMSPTERRVSSGSGGESGSMAPPPPKKSGLILKLGGRKLSMPSAGGGGSESGSAGSGSTTPVGKSAGSGGGGGGGGEPQ